jgi:glucose-1-phosphate cytidylyltransferase
MELLSNGVKPWKITLIDTGKTTMTGGRLKRFRQHIGNETFCFTYGDGVSDLDIRNLLTFHREQAGLATLTAVQPAARFGAFSLEHEQCVMSSFKEKPEGGSGWINGGFFVLEPEAIDYIADDSTVWEREPMETLALLDAYDATNVGSLLFSSPTNGSTVAGAAVKFSVPTVANGKVYVGTQFSFTVFGLLP